MNIIKDVLETEGLGSKSCTSQEDSFLNPLLQLVEWVIKFGKYFAQTETL